MSWLKAYSNAFSKSVIALRLLYCSGIAFIHSCADAPCGIDSYTSNSTALSISDITLLEFVAISSAESTSGRVSNSSSAVTSSEEEGTSVSTPTPPSVGSV